MSYLCIGHRGGQHLAAPAPCGTAIRNSCGEWSQLCVCCFLNLRGELGLIKLCFYHPAFAKLSRRGPGGTGSSGWCWGDPGHGVRVCSAGEMRAAGCGCAAGTGHQNGCQICPKALDKGGGREEGESNNFRFNSADALVYSQR